MLLHVPGVLSADQVGSRAPGARWRGVGRRARHGGAAVLARETEPAAAGECSGGARGRRPDPRRPPAQPAVHVRRAAVEGLPADVQSLRRRALVRQSRRQRHPAGARVATSGQDRSLGNALPRRSRQLRRRRPGHLRHLWRALGQAPRRRHGAVSVDEPASRHPCDRRASASPRSSGSRAWFATTAGARCCSTWTRRSSNWRRTHRIIPRPCS